MPQVALARARPNKQGKDSAPPEAHTQTGVREMWELEGSMQAPASHARPCPYPGGSGARSSCGLVFLFPLLFCTRLVRRPGITGGCSLHKSSTTTCLIGRIDSGDTDSGNSNPSQEERIFRHAGTRPASGPGKHSRKGLDRSHPSPLCLFGVGWGGGAAHPFMQRGIADSTNMRARLVTPTTLGLHPRGHGEGGFPFDACEARGAGTSGCCGEGGPRP